MQITSEIDRFACAHCGTEHVVRRGGGVISLAPIVEGLERVQTGVDKTASELAIVRLKGEISELRAQRLAPVPPDARTADRGPVLKAALLGVVLFLVAALLGASGFQQGALLMMVLAFTVAVGGSAIGFNQNKDATQRYFASLDEQIAEKKEELARHQKTVST